MKRKRGLTIIELLVVIAIIGILLAIIVPAVMAARESARQTTCRNNIKQLCLALQNYHDAHRMFPINYGAGPFTAENRGASWMAMILPEIERQNLFNKISFGDPLADTANEEAAKTTIGVFICPSDTTGGKMDFRANVPGEWAVNNYKACAGSNWDWGTFGPRVSEFGRFAGNPDGLDHCNGLICRGYSRPVITRIANVSDGMANTFAIGEAVPEWSRHTWWWWFNASTATCAIPLNYKQEPDLQVEGDGDWWHNYSFLSRHRSGANFGLADGSVRFISDEIDSKVYANLGTIQGNESAIVP